MMMVRSLSSNYKENIFRNDSWLQWLHRCLCVCVCVCVCLYLQVANYPSHCLPLFFSLTSFLFLFGPLSLWDVLTVWVSGKWVEDCNANLPASLSRGQLYSTVTFVRRIKSPGCMCVHFPGMSRYMRHSHAAQQISSPNIWTSTIKTFNSSIAKKLNLSGVCVCTWVCINLYVITLLFNSNSGCVCICDYWHH